MWPLLFTRPKLRPDIGLLRTNQSISVKTFGPYCALRLSFLQGAIGLIFWAFVCRQRSIVDPSKKRRDVLHWGLCVPASCDNSDVEAHLRAMISPLGASMGLEGSISVEACQSAHQHRPPLSAAALALM